MIEFPAPGRVPEVLSTRQQANEPAPAAPHETPAPCWQALACLEPNAFDTAGRLGRSVTSDAVLKAPEKALVAEYASGVGVELTLFAKSDGPLTKRIALDGEQRVVSDSSTCRMAMGHAKRLQIADAADLAVVLRSMSPCQAIALGRLRADLPDVAPVVPRRWLGGNEAPPGAIARTREHIDFAPGEPTFTLLDFDRKGLPEAAASLVATHGGLWPALLAAAPGLARAARIRRASTSAGLFDRRTRATVGTGVGGEHVYLLVRDGADAERFLRDLHDRCWLHGLGWFLVGAAGQLLERSIVDPMVGAPERLVFEGAPVLVEPLAQDHTVREPEWIPGEVLDTCSACPPLTVVEKARVRETKESARAALASEAAQIRAAADRALAECLVERDRVPAATALRIVEARHRGVLLPSIELAFDDPEIGTVTVAEVLRDPKRFAGETLADPHEGVSYGRCTAKVMRRDDGVPWISSFAHGRATYALKLDSAALETILRRTDHDSVVDVYVGHLLDADLEPDEEQRLSALVCDLSGTKARPLAARVRAARDRQAREDGEERQRALSLARAQTRPGWRRMRLPAPLAGDERTPVLAALDEVLGSVTRPEPPMRNADGFVAEIRARRPWGLHALTDTGADAGEAPRERLPSPEEPLITPLDVVRLGLLVEEHVEHYRLEASGVERAVALPGPFLQAYLAWPKSRLPTVRAVVSAPVVTRTGGVLAGEGLDRQLEIVFRIEPQLLALVPPDPSVITDAEVVDALRFLLDEWLCDVATGFSGRIVLIAYALTIIERVLLPERPAFFVTAGQRGGGKTTVTTMVVVAVLGRRPPAAAWSPSPEERRKALLAYLGEGVATLVWDNIERGALISCPSIEKALTAAEFSDRILGASRTITVPSTTVQAFTGNNIGPRSDMASRSLVCRLEVGRPDPENRAFRHPDPVGWTLDHRPEVLRALFTLLRWNPQVRRSPAERMPSKTRFKAWWDLVGAPLEEAARLASDAQVQVFAGGQELFRCAPEPVDFGAMIAGGEAEGEENSGMRDLVLLLREAFGEQRFSAAELAALVQPTPASFNASSDPWADDEQPWRSAQEDRAQALRNAFEGATGKALPAGSSTTAHLMGKRLQMVLGRPVDLEHGEIGTVIKARTDHEANAYRVTVIRETRS
ncbi:hypothetical protein ACFQX4_11750 [Roseomonas sp. GCM10028921]